MIVSRDATGKCAHGVVVELRAGRSPIASRRFTAGSGEERVRVKV